MNHHGVFLERPNRFVARVRLDDGTERMVHVASSGRMVDLLVPGANVIIQGEGKPGQKTAGLLAMVEQGGTWVSVDTSVPGKILRKTFADGVLPDFRGYRSVRPEYTYGESRIDFLLTGPDLPPCLAEVKSVTSLIIDPDGARVGRFPDAPTARGTRHLHELARAVTAGFRAAVCFVLQRDDADAFGPYDTIDPEFGSTLRMVTGQGVEIHAWTLDVSPAGVSLGRSVPVRL